MTATPVSLDELIAAREAIIGIMVADMPDDHRHFLIGFKKGEPDWTLLGIADAQHLPAVRWKQHNLDQLAADRRKALVQALERVLFP
jgi:hypothetical protein